MPCLPKNFRVLVVLCCLFVALPFVLFAETVGGEPAEHHESPGLQGVTLVTGLELVGLRRTREATVRRILDLEFPVAEEDIDLERLRGRLLRSGLFVNELELSLVPNEQGDLDLRIEIEDRWTLLPLPIAAYGDAGWTGGLAVIESNLLGTGTFLLSVATLRGNGPSVDSWSGTLGVSGGALQRGRVEPGVFLSGGVSQNEFVFPDGSAYRRFRSSKASARLNLSYAVNDMVKLGSSGGVSWTDVDAGWNRSRRAPDSTLYYLHGFSVEAESRRLVGFFFAGPRATLRYQHGFPLDGASHFDSASLRMEYTAAPFGRHKLLLAADGKLGNEPPTELSGPAGTGYRTLPSRGSVSTRAAAAAIEYEFPVISGNWGSFTLLGFGEGGVYYPDGTLEPFYGPGAGFRVYLARVAIPALGFNIGYNLQEGELAGSVALGMAF